jgi:hypothetical protein
MYLSLELRENKHLGIAYNVQNLASIPKGTSEKEIFEESALYKLICKKISRKQLNNYKDKVELVEKYLPHLNGQNGIGRKGKKYKK